MVIESARWEDVVWLHLEVLFEAGTLAGAAAGTVTGPGAGWGAAALEAAG